MAFIRCTLEKVGNPALTGERWIDDGLAVVSTVIRLDGLPGSWTVTQVHPEQITTPEEYRAYAASFAANGQTIQISRSAHRAINDITITTPWDQVLVIS